MCTPGIIINKSFQFNKYLQTFRSRVYKLKSSLLIYLFWRGMEGEAEGGSEKEGESQTRSMFGMEPYAGSKGAWWLS